MKNLVDKLALIKEFKELNAQDPIKLRDYDCFKDRYPDILVYSDDTEQGQKAKVDLTYNDYINASDIVFEDDEIASLFSGNGVEFFATQCPLVQELNGRDTRDSFWDMVKTKDVKYIAALGSRIEHYWEYPESIHFRIEIINVDDMGDYEKRIIKVIEKSDEPGEEAKSITEVNHYWYKNWEDRSVPQNMAAFRQFIEEFNCSEANKIVAHCSAGIGRTGVFCAALMMYKTGDGDSLNIISKLREGRTRMVQTIAQLAFLEEFADTYVGSGIAELFREDDSNNGLPMEDLYIYNFESVPGPKILNADDLIKGEYIKADDNGDGAKRLVSYGEIYASDTNLLRELKEFVSKVESNNAQEAVKLKVGSSIFDKLNMHSKEKLDQMIENPFGF